jgi:hypothetical protein
VHMLVSKTFNGKDRLRRYIESAVALHECTVSMSGAGKQFIILCGGQSVV